MQTGPPICWACKHFLNRNTRTCKAFKVIPDHIYFDGGLHDLPVKGDNGIRFEAKDTPEARQLLQGFTR